MQRKVDNRGYSAGHVLCNNTRAGISTCRSCACTKLDPPLLTNICAVASTKLGVAAGQTVDLSSRLEAEEARLREIEDASERIAAAIADTGGMLPALTRKAVELAATRKAALESIEDLRKQLIEPSGSLFDEEYALNVLSVLYEKSEAAKAVRADCNARLRRVVDTVWLWSYEVALVKYKNGNEIQVVPLQSKGKKDLQPNLAKALKGNLILPS